MRRRRFLLAATAAGVAIATTDIADVARRLWPGFSARRDAAAVSAVPPWNQGETALRYLTRLGNERYIVVDGQAVRPGDLVQLDGNSFSVKRAEASGLVMGMVVPSPESHEGWVTVQTSGMVRVGRDQHRLLDGGGRMMHPDLFAIPAPG